MLLILLFLLKSSIVFCQNKHEEIVINQVANIENNIPIIVVHGTMYVGPVSLFNSFVLEKKQNINWIKREMKHHKKPCLKKIDTNLYEFVWPGHLSHYERLEVAKNLYREINILFKNTPIILVGHSHGGTVILNAISLLIKNMKNCCAEIPVIKKIILAGTPIDSINNKNANLAASIKIPVYNFFSHNDWIQIIDYSMGCHRSGYKRPKRIYVKDQKDLPIYNIHLSLERKNKRHNPGHLGYPGFFVTKHGFHSIWETGKKYIKSESLFCRHGLHDLIYITDYLEKYMSDLNFINKDQDTIFLTFKYL